MKKILLITVIVIISQIANTQNQTFEWAKKIGGLGFDAARSVAIDDYGNLYITGSFQGTVDFDPGPGTLYLTADGFDDAYIIKLDSEGDLVWVKLLAGPNDTAGHSITISDSGNIYITGAYTGTADFDPGVGEFNLTSTAGGMDIFISKLDSDGNFIYAKSMGGIYIDYGMDIKVDESENVFVIGTFREIVDFDPGPGIDTLSSEGSYDVFILKLDHSGNLDWVKQMGGYGTDVGNSLEIDEAGNIYSIGNFEYTVDFNPNSGTFNLTSGGEEDVFISKLNSDGDFIWAKQFTGIDRTIGRSIKVSDSGNIYTTGSFIETTDFDPSPNIYNLTSGVSRDIFISKLDSSGNFVWAKQLAKGGTPGGIDVDVAENVYVNGSFNGVTDLDPGAGTFDVTSNGNSDVFILKLDNSGEFVWARQMGGTDIDFTESILIDPYRNIYSVGAFQETVDFNSGAGTFNLTSGGGYDGFIHKIGQCSSTSTDVYSLCDPLTWIDGNTYTSSNNTALYNIINGAANGCDSVVKLDLTINSTTGIDIESACDSITWIDGNTYSASNNTAMYTLTNAAGCDSIVTLDLTITNIDNSVTDYSSLLSANESGATYQWLDCNDNYVPIAGETDQFYILTANGNYAVEITQNGCKDTSDCITVSNVGIDENTFANSIWVYPNPTTGKINIDLVDVNSEVTIKVSNVLGQNIYISTIEGQEHTELNIEGGRGVYFVELSSGRGERSLVKVIKN